VSGPLIVGPDGKVTLVPSKAVEIIKPEVVVEAERQKDLAKQRMHRQVALEMYCAEISHGLGDHDLDLKKTTKEVRELVLDECVELASYLIEKTGGHQ
jgi:hypothetical protein